MLDQPQMLRGKVENCTDVKSTVGWTNIGQPFANIEYYYGFAPVPSSFTSTFVVLIPLA
jgi:hypothetical protein